MKTLTATAAYGYQELSLLYKRNMMIAMMIAVSIQIIIIGSYHLKELLKTSEPPIKIITINVGELLPPPLIEKPIQNIGIITNPAKFAGGTPIPIPDCDVKADLNYATPNEINEAKDKERERIGDAEVVIREPIKPAEELEPSPEAWISIERYPQVVMNAIPEYPDIAKRIGLEGSVFVKVLLDKEGKVKKTLLIKTSDEIFNEAALNAAKKWVFTPALMNGRPVQVWVSIPFRFKLATN